MLILSCADGVGAEPAGVGPGGREHLVDLHHGVLPAGVARVDVPQRVVHQFRCETVGNNLAHLFMIRIMKMS